jgi:hypothetical protein
MLEIVALYMWVELELLSRFEPPEHLRCVVVSPDAADISRGYLGSNTPLAQTILGHQVGEQLAYTQGDLVGIRILSAVPAPEIDPEDAARRRRDEVARDERLIAQKNAAAFAASFSGKWGDYDPDGVDRWEPPTMESNQGN